MQELKEKLINELNKYAFSKDEIAGYTDKEALKIIESRNSAIECAIKAVNEVIEEYANQSTDTSSNWIPVSERLPRDNGTYIAQTLDGNIRTLRFAKDAYELSKYDFEEYKGKRKSLFYQYDLEYGYYEVECVAWQSLPVKYIPPEAKEK